MKTVELGRVLRPHGLRGELKVRLHFDGSGTLTQVQEVELACSSGPRRFAIEWVRPGTGSVLLKLVGVDDRDAADLLKGAALSVPRSALPEPEPGEYYLSDLIGAEVVDPDGTIGEVVEVRSHPSVVCIAVRLPDGQVLEQPLTAPWLEEVDLEAGRVILSSREGMV
ncbi:MAG: 16S rRNA processing protein RimM [Myxococcales bacterium]|nr:16S rRNA processing protein RimM [Myxococcales bacterium]